jgi:poly [ADP-ribose] polymerase
LDPKASICEFYAEIDDKKVVGQIKEKEAAKNIYDDVIASGHGAYMLEQQETSKQFTASIGNLPPGKEVLIVIVYVTELELDESGKLKLVLPATPYPPDGVNSKKFTLPKQQDGKYSKEVGYGLKINVDLDMSSNIKSISSPTHPIQFEFGDTPSKAAVSLAHNEEGVPLGKDFELLVYLEQPNK